MTINPEEYPYVGGTLRNINRIVRLTYHPCQSPDLDVYIETALEAAAPVLIEFFQPGLIDVIQFARGRRGNPLEYGRPSPRGRSGHSRRVRVAKPRVHRPKTTRGERLIFTVLGPLERAFYWLMVADLASEFVLRWASLIYARQGCAGTGCMVSNNQGTPTTCVIFPPGGYVNQFQLHGLFGRVLPEVDGCIISAGHNYNLTYYLPVFPWDPATYGPASWQLTMATNEQPVGGVQTQGPTSDTAAQVMSGSWGDKVNLRGTRFRWWVDVYQGAVGIAGGNYTVSVDDCAPDLPGMPKFFGPAL